MSASTATLGFGTLLKKGDGGTPEIFTTIFEVIEIGEIAAKADFVEVTHMESPNSFKEYIQGLKDGGSISFKVNFIAGNATHTGLVDDQDAGTSRNWKIVLPASQSNATFSFSGAVESFSVSPALDNKISCSFSIKVSGKITLA